MPKVILTGSPQCQWDIGGHMMPGGTPIELTAEEIKKHKSIVLEEIIEGKVEEKKPVEIKPKKYGKEDLLLISEEKGISGLREIGKKFNVTFKTINEGIKKILEAQK